MQGVGGFKQVHGIFVYGGRINQGAVNPHVSDSGTEGQFTTV